MFKELFTETVKIKDVNDITKELYKVVKKVRTPLDVIIDGDDNLINIYLIGKKLPAGVTKMGGTNTSIGSAADKNEREFKAFNKKFQSELKKSPISIEDYDFSIDNTQKATIFLVV